MKIFELNLSWGNSFCRVCLCFLFSINVASLNAQTTIATAGSEATGAVGTCSYTVGQVVYVTHTDNATSEAQGVQQPFEISTVVSLVEAECFELALSIYPNPSRNVFILNIGDYNFENLSYQLIDVSGQLVMSGKIVSGSTTIDATGLAADNYFLTVADENTVFKIFKLIKC